MPYILPELRRLIDPAIFQLLEDVNETLADTYNDEGRTFGARDGIANYTITRIIDDLYGSGYVELNAAIGVLECAKLEIYRRIVAPYEDKKITENGDVYIFPHQKKER